jgi:hypothetical protein
MYVPGMVDRLVGCREEMPRWWWTFLRSDSGTSAGFEVEDRRRGLVVGAAVAVTDDDAADGCEGASFVAGT